jgi:hypothetical protein
LWEELKSGETKNYFNDPGQLWFALPRSFGDDHEGTFPRISKSPEEYCDNMAKELRLSPDEAAEKKARFCSEDTDRLRIGVAAMAQLCGVTCWHENDAESDRMWNEYVGDDDGVVVRTTYSRLEKSLGWAHNSPIRDTKPKSSRVGYVDLDSFFLPDDGFYNLLSLKSPGFLHENEIRVFAKSPWFSKMPMKIRKPFPPDPRDWATFLDAARSEKKDDIETTIQLAESTLTSVEEKDQKGFNLPVSLADLVEAIVAKPGATKKYIDTVNKRLSSVGLDINTEESTL